jgi:hypothetical protein
MCRPGPQAHRVLQEAIEEDMVDHYTYLLMARARQAELVREAQAARLAAAVQGLDRARWRLRPARPARAVPRLRRA